MSLERMNIVRYYELGTSPTRVKINRLRDTMLRCRDGGYVKVVVHPDRQWRGLVKALDSPKWAEEGIYADHKAREENYELVTARLNEEAAKFDAEELFFRIQDNGTACAPVCSAEQVFNSPQTIARDFYVEIGHSEAGALKYPGIPYQFSESAPGVNCGAPLLGQHNEEIYCGCLGFSKPELVSLKEAGVI
jgi:crotonobetainyl-CoA:carnitine CoA-transferase CaiB-like acyl-CoA transferase